MTGQAAFQDLREEGPIHLARYDRGDGTDVVLAWVADGSKRASLAGQLEGVVDIMGVDQPLSDSLELTEYPDEPDVEAWKRYAADVWSDWWAYRDVGINDSGYFYSSFCNILRAAELLGHKEVFTDPESRKLFDRIVGDITPDGAGVPYGASGGYHGQAGACIFALELAARYTRDGRYRPVAHRIMNYGQQRGFSRGHHHLQAVSHEFIALAGLLCDDSVAPVEPDGGSQPAHTACSGAGVAG